MKEEDWNLSFEKLVMETKKSIEKFSAEHNDEIISYINYDTDPIYGYVLVSYNTLEHSNEFTRKQHDYNLSYIRERIEKPSWQKYALERLKSRSFVPHCDSPGDFKYMGYSEIKFPDWESFSRSEKPSEAEESNTAYLDRNVSMLLWRAMDKLAETDAFNNLKLSSPTLLGFNIHDSAPVVTRMLNLP